MKKKIIILGICLTLLIPVLSISASANSPPETPSIQGPTSGKAGKELTYEICSSDPDGDDIYYCLDWGDGSGEICIGPYPSATCITQSHTWSSDGTYTIKVKARDTNDAESDYGRLQVKIPRVRTSELFLHLLMEKIFTRSIILRILMSL